MCKISTRLLLHKLTQIRKTINKHLNASTLSPHLSNNIISKTINLKGPVSGHCLQFTQPGYTCSIYLGTPAIFNK